MGGVACKGGKDKEAAYYQNSAKIKTILESINRTTGDSDAGIFRKRYVKGRVKKNMLGDRGKCQIMLGFVGHMV